MARPLFEPTDPEREIVRGLAAYGAPQAAICYELWVGREKLAPGRGAGPGFDKPLTEKTLRRAFKTELARGLDSANSRVWESVLKRAVNLKHPQGALSAFYWLNTRGGQKVTQRVEHSGKVAYELDLEGATLEEIEVLERVLARQAAKLAPPIPANDAAA